MQKSVTHALLVCVFAFLGGFVSDQFFSPRSSHAELVPDLLAREPINTGETYKDSKKRKRISLGATPEGPPIQEFYGEDGTVRLQIGTYKGYEGQTPDSGLPLISLMDNTGKLRLLLRVTDGKNKSPALVMKDSKGEDRVVLGLSVNREGEEPFLAYFDKLGGKHMVFGNY